MIGLGVALRQVCWSSASGCYLTRADYLVTIEIEQLCLNAGGHVVADVRPDAGTVHPVNMTGASSQHAEPLP
jgi:hypothetical protein